MKYKYVHSDHNADIIQYAMDNARRVEDIGKETPVTQGVNGGMLPALPPQFIPFPMEILHPVVKEFVEQTARTLCCDPTLVLLPTLSVMAGAIGGTRRATIRSTWSEPSILWTMVVADSGSAKSPALDAPCRPLHALQKEAVGDIKEQLERYEEAKREFYRQKKKGSSETFDDPVPQMQDIYLDDTTVEAIAPALLNRPRGSVIVCEELSGWFQRLNAYKNGGGGDESFYLQAHGGRSTKINRKSGPKIYIPQTVLSITGTIQRQILKNVLSQTHIGSGMAARFLFAMPPEHKRKWSDDEVPENIIQDYHDLIIKLSQLRFQENDPVYLGMTKGAKRRFIEFYNEIGCSRPDIESAEMKAAWAKLEGGAVRLALVFSCVRYVIDGDSREVINERDIEAGIIASKWFAGEAERIYAMLTESPEEREIQDLVSWVIAQGGSVVPYELAKRKKYRPSGSADQALSKLVRRGYGTWGETATTAVGGKPVRRFTLTKREGNQTLIAQAENRGSPPKDSTEDDAADEFDDVPVFEETDNSCVDFTEVSNLFGGRA